MEKNSFDDESSSGSASYRLLGGESGMRQKSRLANLRWHHIALVLNCLLLALNTALTTRVFSTVTSRKLSNWDDVHIPSHEYTDEALDWEVRRLDDVFHAHESPYRGPPRPELDRAWQSLMKGFDMRVPYPGWTSPSSPNFTMVRLNDGTNEGMAVPTVLHELHCLRTIREYFLPEHYPITAARYPHAPGELNVHVDHCIDNLRTLSMCHADMTLMTYEWWDRTPFPQVVPMSQHKCANWEKLTNWIQDRAFNRRGDILVHPKTGVIPSPWNGTDPTAAHDAYWASKGEPWNFAPKHGVISHQH